MRSNGPSAARWARRLRASALLWLVLAWAGTASAQERSGSKAAAEALFQQGKALYESGDYEQACAKFAASQELDAGFGTLMNLGECYDKRRMTASAWATFKEAAALAHAQGQNDREAVARERAAALEARLATLVVHASDEVAALPGLDIRLNGTSLPRAVWGSPVPVDPGPQRLVLTAPGHKSFTRDVNVAEGSAAVRVDVPALEREAPPQAAASSQPESQRASLSAPLASPAPAVSGSPQRVIGFVTGGVGLAALAVGSVFGARAISKNSESNADFCRTETLCSPRGLELREEARDAARASTVAFVAGGVLVAAGLTLVLTAPPRARTGQSAALHPGLRRLELGSLLGAERAALELRGAW